MTDQRKIAVVFVAYGCVPTSRVDDHFGWNNRLYRESMARVYMVVDSSHDAGDYVTQCLMPLRDMPRIDGKPVFSLCLTKNFGIQCALDDGADVIICTDVDVAFPQVPWDVMCEVEPGQAIMPVYHLCEKFENRHTEPGRVDYGMSGTTAMVADHWREIQYDERCVGYGADDGILMRDIERAGIELIPPACFRTFPAAPIVWHVDHTTDVTDNVPGSGRGDCWGRAEGFNPDNFEANQKFHSGRRR